MPSRVATKKRPNAVRRLMEREENVRSRNATAAAAQAATNRASSFSSRLRCPNKQCPGGKIEGGTCTGCGVVVDDSNIVAEVTFGETSNGAAIVQGSYMAADQGGVRAAPGSAFRRVAGGTSESRERTFRDVRQTLSQLVRQLRLPESYTESAFRNYKMASLDFNFTQGRKKEPVAAVCLYAVCRREPSCKVMLIDLADLCSYDVFQMGRDYKRFLELFPDQKLGMQPPAMEDLIWRFCSRLEFGRDSNKVATSAVRIAKRMQFDQIDQGRKPAGLCGAACIMAARAHNYRRTVREVVYVAKVAMYTINMRMEEFANVPSAQMSIEEFSTQDFIEAQHDPPVVYKRTREWLEKHPKKQKRKRGDLGHEDEPGKRQLTGEANGRGSAGNPNCWSEDAVDLLTPSGAQPPRIHDNDGFAIPPLPARAAQPTPDTDDRAVIQEAIVEGDSQLLDVLAEEYGNEDVDPSSERAMAMAQGIEVPSRRKLVVKARASKKHIAMPIDDAWTAEENELESEMQELMPVAEQIGREVRAEQERQKRNRQKQRAADKAAASTPVPGQEPVTGLPSPSRAGSTVNTETCSNRATGDIVAEQDDHHVEDGEDDFHTRDDVPRGVQKSFSPAIQREMSKVSSSRIIQPDEFKDDPEVTYCLLSEQEVAIKEQIWANHNKEYMRQQQQALFNRKMEAKKPKRVTRKKKDGVRKTLGTPGSTPGDGVKSAMNKRGVSMRINYDFDNDMFMSKLRGSASAGSRSAATSRATSVVDGAEVRALSASRVDAAAATAMTPTPPTEELDPQPEHDDNDHDDVGNMYDGDDWNDGDYEGDSCKGYDEGADHEVDY